MSKTTIGIVGLGLMGGSFSIALKETSNKYYFVGLDHNEKHSKKALEMGLVDKIVHSLDEIKSCDIILLTIPVDGIISVAKNLGTLSAKCTIIDLGSTKEKISNSIPTNIRKNFVTAHPMTGTEKFGPSASIANLYRDKVVVLCDMQKSGTYQQTVAKELFSSIEMKLVEMGAKEHDRHAAFISHMPHAVSYALAKSVIKQEDAQSIVALAGGGFRDMSRIAKSSPNMWEDIFRQNRENLLESISSFQYQLQKCKNMIENEEWEELNSWMKSANKLHDIL
jgi:prephenate dehydrogenase